MSRPPVSRDLCHVPVSRDLCHVPVSRGSGIRGDVIQTLLAYREQGRRYTGNVIQIPDRRTLLMHSLRTFSLPPSLPLSPFISCHVPPHFARPSIPMLKRSKGLRAYSRYGSLSFSRSLSLSLSSSLCTHIRTPQTHHGQKSPRHQLRPPRPKSTISGPGPAPTPPRPQSLTGRPSPATHPSSASRNAESPPATHS